MSSGSVQSARTAARWYSSVDGSKEPDELQRPLVLTVIAGLSLLLESLLLESVKVESLSRGEIQGLSIQDSGIRDSGIQGLGILDK